LKKKHQKKNLRENIKKEDKKVIQKKGEVLSKSEKDTKIDASKIGLIKEYTLEIDKASVKIRIERKEDGLFYNLIIPQVNIATSALLEDIRKNLVSITTTEVGEITDKKSIKIIKDRFMEDARKLLKEKLPHIEEKTQDFLIGILMQDMLGLGKIEFLINDPELEEIVIVSAKEPVRTYHRDLGWMITNIELKSEDEINNYANIIARRIGRQITVLTPLLDAHMVTGDRSNAVLYPVATKGNTITIRKFARDPWTIIDLIKNKTTNIDVSAILWIAIEYEMNILISGGTASGKTVFLNACMPFMPPNHRIISMEDTRELMLPEFLYWTPLVTRLPNAEGKGEVSMLDLLVNSLRMRPDRIILGEMRKQKEAEVLFEAMHTGHSVYATVHADTSAETIRRLINPPINIPPTMLNNVNLNVVMFRHRKKGIRRVYQLAEFIPSKDIVSSNILYRWIPEKDTISPHNESRVFFDDLNRHTGMSQSELNKDLEERKSILNWMLKNNIRDLNSIGKVMNIYYNNKDILKSIIRKNEISRILKTPEKPEKEKKVDSE